MTSADYHVFAAAVACGCIAGWLVAVIHQHTLKREAIDTCKRLGHKWVESDHPTHIIHTCERCGYRAGQRIYMDDEEDWLG